MTVAVGRDTWILQSSPDKNHAGDGHMKLNPRSGNVAFGLVRFQLPQIPAGCAVANAELKMFASTYKSNRTLEAVRADADWKEDQVAWSNRPSVEGNAAQTQSGQGWRTWDVTQQARHQYGNANHGFIIRVAGNGDHEQVFRTKENGNNAPRLIVTFGPPG